MFDLFNLGRVRALEAEVHRLKTELAATESTAETHRTQYNAEASKVTRLSIAWDNLSHEKKTLELRVATLEAELKMSFKVLTSTYKLQHQHAL